jgi:hypothetical protein
MEYFTLFPVTQSQCLKHGNSSRKAVSTSLNRDMTELEKVLLAPGEILGERFVL